MFPSEKVYRNNNENIRGFDPRLLTLTHDFEDQRRAHLRNIPQEVLVEKLLETERYLLNIASNSKETRYRLSISDLEEVYDNLKEDLYHYRDAADE